MFLFLPTIQRT